MRHVRHVSKKRYPKFRELPAVASAFLPERPTQNGASFNKTQEILGQEELALWYRFAIKENFKGANFLVVYGDDFIAGFELESEAKQYYELLKERMNCFNLELEESKSRLIAFSKWICVDSERKGLPKPETFDFLGFTFYSRKTRKGMPTVQLLLRIK